MLECKTHPNEVRLYRVDNGRINHMHRKLKRAKLCPKKLHALREQARRQQSKVDKARNK